MAEKEVFSHFIPIRLRGHVGTEVRRPITQGDRCESYRQYTVMGFLLTVIITGYVTHYTQFTIALPYNTHSTSWLYAGAFMV